MIPAAEKAITRYQTPFVADKNALLNALSPAAMIVGVTPGN